jgi:hypothetical protein
LTVSGSQERSFPFCLRHGKWHSTSESGDKAPHSKEAVSQVQFLFSCYMLVHLLFCLITPMESGVHC